MPLGRWRLRALHGNQFMQKQNVMMKYLQGKYSNEQDSNASTNPSQK